MAEELENNKNEDTNVEINNNDIPVDAVEDIKPVDKKVENTGQKGVQLYDEKLEAQLLGLILIDNRVMQYIEAKSDYFYFDINKKIFEEINNLLDKDFVADVNTLKYALDRKVMNKTGSAKLSLEEIENYIKYLIDWGTGCFSKPKTIVKILQHLSVKRRLNLFYGNVADVLQDGDLNTFSDKMNIIESDLYNILNSNSTETSYRQLGKFTDILKEKLKKARESNNDVNGVKTGLTDIDFYTGGLQKSDLIIIAARPSMGKTALATTILKNVATIINKDKKEGDEKKSVAMFSLEMSGEQVATRIVAMDSKFSTKTIRTGRYDELDEFGEPIKKNEQINDAQWTKIVSSMQDVGKLPIFIDDTPALNISVLRSRARFLKSKYGVCAIIIDYLQLLRPSRPNQNRVLEVAEITSTLKAIAKELNIPVVALSQLSRSVETRGADGSFGAGSSKRPQLSDLRESGTIEQDADIVMFLYREEYYMSRKEPKITDPSDEQQATEHAKWLQKYEKIKNLAEIIVAKNRNGRVGTVFLTFDMEHMVFGNLAKEDYSNILPPNNGGGYQKIGTPQQNQGQNAISSNFGGGNFGGNVIGNPANMKPQQELQAGRNDDMEIYDDKDFEMPDLS